MAHATSAVRETARGGGIPRALALLQNRPRTSLELQLSPNAISPSLKPSHLTPWLSWNSPSLTTGDSAHGGTAAVTQHGRVGHLGPMPTLITDRSPSLT